VGLGLLIVEVSRLHSTRHTKFGRTPQDELSERRTELYQTTHNTRMGQTTISSAAFELSIPASERPETHALNRAATGIGHSTIQLRNFSVIMIYSGFFREF